MSNFCDALGIAALAAGWLAGMSASAVEPQFQLLRFGEVMPAGWIQAQMQRDLQGGFAGHLAEIAPKTASQNIFTTGRNRPGKLSAAGGESGGSSWWNAETEGNWRSGNTMMTLLAGTPEQRAALDARVNELLKFQDADGYMGIYSPELRWKGDRGFGELWSQTCLLRGLIAYYEATGKKEVLAAVERAAQLTIRNYTGKTVSDGSHSLMFTDVTERLYDLTSNPVYRDFGLQLCQVMATSGRGHAEDFILGKTLNPELLFTGHGARTCEHLRLALWCATTTGLPHYRAAVDIAFRKALRQVSPTGGPVAQEDFEGKVFNPDTTGYESCTVKEWMTSCLSAAQKSGDARFADRAEDAFFNAIQAARLPDGKGVTYCTYDNAVRRMGPVVNGKGSYRKGDRLKFSPCHEDVANCCAPNHSQVASVFVRNMWMRAPDGLAAALYGPCKVHTTVSNIPVAIEEETNYPFSDKITFRVTPDAAVPFVLRLRVPAWAVNSKAVCPGATVIRTDGWILVSKTWNRGDSVSLDLTAQVEQVPANCGGSFYLRRGPLFYAYPIAAEMIPVKNYALPDFHDYHVTPKPSAKWNYALPAFDTGMEPPAFTAATNPAANSNYPWDTVPLELTGKLINMDTKLAEQVELVPMGCGDAKLRRCAFPSGPANPERPSQATHSDTPAAAADAGVQTQGQYFAKKTYTPVPLPTFEKTRPLLPSPVYDANPGYVAMYWKTWELAFRNFHEPKPGSGFVSQYIDAAFNQCTFQWDSCFMSMFCNVAHPLVPGISSLDNFYAKQYADGEICRELVRDTGKDYQNDINTKGEPFYSNWGYHIGHGGVKKAVIPYRGRPAPSKPSKLTLDAMNHPLFSWAEMEFYRTTGDKTRLAMIYPPLVKYHEALQEYLRQGNGLYMTDWASMDNSPRTPYLAGGGCGADISCEMALFARDMARMARDLGKPADATRFETEARELDAAINRLMWDPQRNFYFDLTAQDTRVPVKSIAGYWALIAGVASKEQAAALADELKNPKTFGRLHPVPTVAADEPGYNPKGGYWCGAVWPPTTTMVIRGLEKYGYTEQAREIALKDLDVTWQVFQKTGTVWENYAPDAIAPGTPAKPDLVGWTGLAPILYLLEYGVGLKPDAPRNELMWDLRSDKRVGCERYRFNGHVVDLLATPDKGNTWNLSVKSDGAFRLIVKAAGKERTFDIRQGGQTLLVSGANPEKR